VLVDTYDGFGGFSASLMEDVVDDFSGKGILTFSLTPPVFPDYVILSYMTVLCMVYFKIFVAYQLKSFCVV